MLFRSALEHAVEMIRESPGCHANHWLNALLLDDREQRDAFLAETNDRGIMTRPLWTLMPDLPMYSHCHHDGLPQSRRLADRLVNIPSSVVNA